MSNATLETDYPQAAVATVDDDDYREIHIGAVLGLLIAIVSLVYPFTVTSFADVRQSMLLAVAPIVGLVVSHWAWRKVRASPELYTGGQVALSGMVIAALSLLLGTANGVYVYATEVPEGYTRSAFAQMKPDEFEMADMQYITPEVRSLLGQKVFIKGYIRPNSTNNGLTKSVSSFLLVRDSNECCFGDISKLQFYDQMKVDLLSGLTTDYHEGIFRVGGELGVRPGNPRESEPPLVYSLKADYIK